MAMQGTYSMPPASPPPAWADRGSTFMKACIGALDTSEAKTALRSLFIKRETATRFGLGWWNANASDRMETWGLQAGPSRSTGRPLSVWLPRGLVVPIRRARGLVGLQIYRADWTPGDKYPRSVFVRGGTVRTWIAGSPGRPMAVVRDTLDAVLLAQEAGDLAATLSLPEGSVLDDSDLAGLDLFPSLVWTADGTGDRALPAGKPLDLWPTPRGTATPMDMARAGKSVRGWIRLAVERREEATGPEASRPAVVEDPEPSGPPVAGHQPIAPAPTPMPVQDEVRPMEAPASDEEDAALSVASVEAYRRADPAVRRLLDEISAMGCFALRTDCLGQVHAVDAIGFPATQAQVFLYAHPDLERWVLALPSRQWQPKTEAAGLADMEDRNGKRPLQKHERSRRAA